MCLLNTKNDFCVLWCEMGHSRTKCFQCVLMQIAQFLMGNMVFAKNPVKYLVSLLNVYEICCVRHIYHLFYIVILMYMHNNINYIHACTQMCVHVQLPNLISAPCYMSAQSYLCYLSPQSYLSAPCYLSALSYLSVTPSFLYTICYLFQNGFFPKSYVEEDSDAMPF